MSEAIDRAWEAALDELGAGDADIERGLRIHRDAIVCDPVSGGARPWSPAMSALARELIRNGTAPQDMELQLQEVADRDVVADAEVRSEYLEAWRRSGVTLANDYGHMFCSWRTEGFGGLVGRPDDHAALRGAHHRRARCVARSPDQVPARRRRGGGQARRQALHHVEHRRAAALDRARPGQPGDLPPAGIPAGADPLLHQPAGHAVLRPA